VVEKEEEPVNTHPYRVHATDYRGKIERNSMSDKSFYIGMDLGGTNIKCGLVTGDGVLIQEKRTATEADGGVDHVLGRMEELIRNTAAVRPDSEIRGVGIGMPGLVDAEGGVFIEGPNLKGWTNVNLNERLGGRLGMPICIDNDAHVAALGEFAFGAGRGSTDMLMVTLGTGVGGGLVLNGKLYRGKRNTAGEFGHTTIQMDGPLCNCGRRGCIEAFVGKNGIIRNLIAKLDSGRASSLASKDRNRLEPLDISLAAGKGDGLAVEVLRETGEYLGVGLGNAVNLLNLERIVVGGQVADAGDFILRPARDALDRIALKVPRETVRIVPAELGNSAGIIGAARLAMLAFSAA
jgi:glucokinase